MAVETRSDGDNDFCFEITASRPSYSHVRAVSICDRLMIVLKNKESGMSISYVMISKQACILHRHHEHRSDIYLYLCADQRIREVHGHVG